MKNFKSSIGLILAPLLLLAACGNETGEVHDAILAVSPNSAFNVGDDPVTQIWIVEQKDGKCVVLDDHVTVTVNGKAAQVVSRGNAPDWIDEKYNRYAGCAAPLFRIAGGTVQKGTEIDVNVSGGGIAASTHFVFSGSGWGITQCSGVKSCCESDASALRFKCVDSTPR